MHGARAAALLNKPSDVQRAVRLLRRFGSNAHVWLPGIGQLNGLQTANYLLSDASTGLAPVDQYVGRVNDAMGVLGAERVQSGFDGTWTGVGWTAAGGIATASGTTSTLFKSNIITAGKTYQVTVRCNSYTSGGWKCLQEGGASYFGDKTSAGTFTGILTATNTGGIFLWANSALTASFDSISVREVTGIHATQPTTANKPRLVRGVVNKLLWSNDLSNEAWVKSNTANTTNTVAAPDGSTTAGTVKFTATNTQYTQQVFTSVAGATYTQVFVVQRNNCDWVQLGMYDNANRSAYFNLATGALGSVDASVSADSIALGNGWYLVRTTYTTSFSGSSVQFIHGANGSGNNSSSINDTVNVYRAGLIQGTYTAQQIQALGGIPLTTTASASTSGGAYAWSFDGGDSLTLGNVPFQLSDNFVVIAAGSCIDSGVVGKSLFCVGNAGTGFIELGFTGWSPRPRAVFKDDAGIQDTLTDGTQYASAVIAAVKTGDTKRLFINGGLKATVGTTLGSSVASRALIGARYSTATVSSYHVGTIGPVIAIKGTVSDSDLLLIEKLVAALSGITI